MLSNNKVIYVVVAALIFAVVFFLYKRKKTTAGTSNSGVAKNSNLQIAPGAIAGLSGRGVIMKPSGNKNAITNTDVSIFRDKGFSGKKSIEELKALAKAKLIAEGKANADGELIDENGYVLV